MLPRLARMDQVLQRLRRVRKLSQEVHSRCDSNNVRRRFEKVATEFGEVTIKLGLKQGRVVQIAPEFESCRAVSEQSGQPLKAIYQAALAAFAKGSGTE